MHSSFSHSNTHEQNTHAKALGFRIRSFSSASSLTNESIFAVVAQTMEEARRMNPDAPGETLKKVVLAAVEQFITKEVTVEKYGDKAEALLAFWKTYGPGFIDTAYDLSQGLYHLAAPKCAEACRDKCLIL